MSFSPKTDSGAPDQMKRDETTETKKTSGGMTHGKPASDGKYKTFDRKSKLEAMGRRLGK